MMSIPTWKPANESCPSLGRTVAICAGLVLITVIAFWQVGSSDFISYDDPAYVTTNLHVRQGLTGVGFYWAWTTGTESNWHPLTWLSLMLDVQCFGVNSTAMHLVNLAFHAVNTLLLFLVLQWMTGARWPSAWVAAMFAVHPLHVESVAWVTERKDMLSTFFGLIALGAYIWYAQRPSIERYVSVFVALALGLLAKPMLVTWPLLFLVLDFWPLGRLKRTTAIALILEKIPLAAISAASCVVTFLVQKRGGAVSALEHLSVGTRIATAMVGYTRYIGKMLWPVDLAPFYPHPGMPDSGMLAVAVVALLAISTLVAWGTWRGRRYLAVGWLWYLGTLVPVIGLVQVGRQSIADRYSYIPLVGLFLLIAWGATDLTQRWRFQRPALALSTAVLIPACIVTTSLQVSYWKNSESLFLHARQATGDNVVIRDNLGVYYSKNDQFAKAIDEWESALRMDPHYEPAVHYIVLVLRNQGRYDDASRCLEQFLKHNPNSANLCNSLAEVRRGQGRLDEAFELCKEAVRLERENAGFQKNLAKGYYLMAKPQLAVEHWQEALRITPDDLEATEGLGTSLMQQGKFVEAARAFRQTIALEPDNIVARNNLGMALAGLGKWSEAILQWREVLELRADDHLAQNMLAWVLATCPEAPFRNGKEAVTLARAAADSSKSPDPTILDTLAAAYAEAGQFPEAVETANRALKLASNPNQTALATRLRSRLELYRKGSACRDQPPVAEAPGHP